MTCMPLLLSRKNLDGLLFPGIDAVALAGQALPLSRQPWFKNETCVSANDAQGKSVGGVLSVARLDATSKFNTQELAFAKALDRVEFVEDDGRLGDVVNFDNLSRLRQSTRESSPLM